MDIAAGRELQTDDSFVALIGCERDWRCRSFDEMAF